MSTDIVTVQLTRENEEEKWGFQISGGKDQDCPLVISAIARGSIAERLGLICRDMIIKINNEPAANITNAAAEASVDKGANNFALVIQRGLMDIRGLMDNIVEDPRYEGLDVTDRAKVGGNDISKPSLRKDWACPWVKRDGKGLKRIVRNINGEDPTPAPIRTSQHHFYSEPKSILAPEAAPIPAEDLERMIRERMAAQDKAAGIDTSKSQQQQSHKIIQEPTQVQSRPQKQNDHVAMEVDMPAQQQSMKQAAPQNLQHNESLDDEEDFSCPPELEEIIEVQQQQIQERQQALDQQEEHVNVLNTLVQQSVSEDHQHFSQTIVRELAIAIKESMQSYQEMGEFEPSADELIDVLKNLENLAAINPALYRAIVDQINIPTGAEPESDAHQPEQVVYNDEPNLVNGVHDQEVPREDNAYEEINNHVSGEDVVDLENGMQNGHEEVDRAPVKQIQQEMKAPPMSADEMKKEQIRLQVEQEHDQMLKGMKQRKKKQASPPPPPKTITVMAGSRNSGSWPIAPGCSVVKQVQIELVCESQDYEEEMMKNRWEVAEAAGLKHVEVINGLEGERFYPEPMKDYDYPWAGSLKPVSNQMSGREGRREDAGSMPYKGSLRHVSTKNRKKKEESDDDDMYGSAPWMGTLKHVTHENNVTKTFKPTPKFKKYPDEDAPNPFKGMQGRNAKPQYPLSPAAVFQAPDEGGAKDENVMEAEQVDRIRNNLRETRTVSSSLLRVLMPKLLKEHESKYEPLGHDESLNIMEEILAMQIGISADQKVEDNDEAEQIIRAITHGEIDHSVYSQMADDLESAAQEKRKEKKATKKVKKGTGKKKTKKNSTGASESGTEIEASASEVSIPPAAPELAAA